MDKVSTSNARLILADPFADDEKWLRACELINSSLPIVTYADPSQPLAVKFAVALLWAELMVLGQHFVIATLCGSQYLLTVLLVGLLYAVATQVCGISAGNKVVRNRYTAFLFFNMFLKLPVFLRLAYLDDCSGLICFVLTEVILPSVIICLLHSKKSNQWFQMKQDLYDHDEWVKSYQCFKTGATV